MFHASKYIYVMPSKKYLLLEIQRWQVFVAVKLVEVGAEKAVLDDAVFFKLSLGIFLCILCRHLPSVFKTASPPASKTISIRFAQSSIVMGM